MTQTQNLTNPVDLSACVKQIRQLYASTPAFQLLKIEDPFEVVKRIFVKI